jgi:hypothetical protein
MFLKTFLIWVEANFGLVVPANHSNALRRCANRFTQLERLGGAQTITGFSIVPMKPSIAYHIQGNTSITECSEAGKKAWFSLIQALATKVCPSRLLFAATTWHLHKCKHLKNWERSLPECLAATCIASAKNEGGNCWNDVKMVPELCG